MAEVLSPTPAADHHPHSSSWDVPSAAARDLNMASERDWSRSLSHIMSMPNVPIIAAAGAPDPPPRTPPRATSSSKVISSSSSSSSSRRPILRPAISMAGRSGTPASVQSLSSPNKKNNNATEVLLDDDKPRPPSPLRQHSSQQSLVTFPVAETTSAAPSPSQPNPTARLPIIDSPSKSRFIVLKPRPYTVIEPSFKPPRPTFTTATDAINTTTLFRSKSLDETALRSRGRMQFFQLQTPSSRHTPYHSCRSSPSPSHDHLPITRPDALEQQQHAEQPPVDEKKVAEQRERTWHTLKELLDTEKGYLNDLRVLISVYLEPLAQTFDLKAEEVELVMRNARMLLTLHETLQTELGQVDALLAFPPPSAAHEEDFSGGGSSDPTQLESALGRGIDLTARIFLMNARAFDVYQTFCSGHTEALDVIRRLQSTKPTEWDAYERRSALSVSLSLITPTKAASTSPDAARQQHQRHQSMDIEPPPPPLSKLTCMDFLIKPVQRLCRYPLLLGQLREVMTRMGGMRPRSDADPEGLLDLALEVMKGVVSGVDEAKKAREVKVKTRLIAQRMEGHSPLTSAYIASLGDCILAGALDVVHHHILLAPLRPPMKARYVGAFLYAGYLILVKVRRGKVYEPRHYFALKHAEVVDTCPSSGQGSLFMPFSFRVSVGLHHFELAATSVGEKDLWYKLVKQSRLATLGASETYTSLEPLVGAKAHQHSEEVVGMAKFLSDPLASFGPNATATPATNQPEVAGTHVRSASSTVGDAASAWTSAALLNVSSPRRSSFFGVSTGGGSPPVSPTGAGPGGGSLVRRDSAAQHLLVDRNLSDVFSMPCLTLRAPILTMTVSTSTSTHPLVPPPLPPLPPNEEKSSNSPTTRTRSLSRATSKVLSRNSSVGSLFHRRGSMYGAGGGNDGLSVASMPPPPLPHSARSSPTRRRTFLHSLSMLAVPGSPASDPSTVLEAAEEDGPNTNGVDLGTPSDSGYFGDGVSPISPASQSPPVSPDEGVGRHSLDRPPSSRRASVGQNLLEFFTRHSTSTNSIASERRVVTAGVAQRSALIEVSPHAPSPHHAPFPVQSSTSNLAQLAAEGLTSTPSLVQRGVAYVRRKRALSSPGIPVQLLVPANRATMSGSDGSSDSGDVEAPVTPIFPKAAETPDNSIRIRQPVRAKSSIISLRAMLAAEPRKPAGDDSPRRERMSSTPLEQEQQLFPCDEPNPRQKLNQKSSRNLMKRALFQI